MQWKIGLVGFGNVGKAFLSLYKEFKEKWKRDFNLEAKFNFILNSKGGVINENGLSEETIDEILKKSIISAKEWQEGLKFDEVLDSGDINLLVEVSPTNIKDGEPALTYIKSALSKGISVATGNKGPFLYNFKEIFDIAKEKGGCLGIGCTAGAALPTINFGKYSLSGSNIEKIEGVLNGVCNFILTSMEEKGISFEEALALAKKIGIAEANPSLDIDGWDTASKILIIANSLMGSTLTLNDIPVEGIRNIGLEDIERAKNAGKRLKLVGFAVNEDERVKAGVKIIVVDQEHFLYELKGTNKGILYKCYPCGEFIVKGGASSPAGAGYSLWRDIINFSIR
ncbi:MAG: homoserine dehydrogenase [Candidatus Aminicenantia bacterium]